VDQFIRLARQGYYDGSAFFRIFANGLIQGGDPLLKDPKTPRNLWGTGGLSLLASEFSDMKHERGVVSTVSIPNKPDSDGAQFFVCVAPQPALDGKYSAFGRVTEGMRVVEAISRVPATPDQLRRRRYASGKSPLSRRRRSPSPIRRSASCIAR
jgi:cyclophilin family peptidyl-prolyl cis-trans isomerase